MISQYGNIVAAIDKLDRSHRYVHEQYEGDREDLVNFLQNIYNSNQIHAYGLTITKDILCTQLLKPQNKKLLLTALWLVTNSYSMKRPIFVNRYTQANGRVIDLSDVSIIMNIPCKQSFLAEANEILKTFL